jgi:hypothetical protein
MRCADLPGTWVSLRGWLDDTGVLILPRLERDGPTVRLDADVDQSRPAAQAELDRVICLLKAVIERFGVPAVYVGQTAWDPADDAFEPGVHPGSMAIITIRVMAGGILHELTLVAAWYAALLASDAESTALTARVRYPSRRSPDWWPAA